MGIIDKISHWLGFSNDDDEREFEKLESESEAAPKVENKETPPANNVVDFNSVALNKDSSTARLTGLSKSEIKTIKPKSFEDAQVVSKYLLDRMAVVVNLEEIDINVANRITDFVSGTIYAIGGKPKMISSKVILFAPKNVKVEAYEDEKKSKGTFID